MTTVRSKAGALHLLTARQVLNARQGESLADGGGLFLSVSPTAASWALRCTAPDGRRRETGLGIVTRGSVAQAGDSLATARELASKARDLLRQGSGPSPSATAPGSSRRPSSKPNPCRFEPAR
jgi:hypothetical protein